MNCRTLSIVLASIGLVVGAAEGEGTSPIAISSIEELQLIGNDEAYPLDGYYILTGNIDATGTSAWNDGRGFKPIGGHTEPFTGVFDGQGFEIAGLSFTKDPAVIVNSTYSLFDTNNGIIRNVGIADTVGINLDARYYFIVAPLTSDNMGTITNCYAKRTTVSDGTVAGLVNRNYGIIENSYTTGDLTGSSAAGLVMSNQGAITNCYTTGAITATGRGGSAAGLAISNHDGGTITNCFATGAVSGGDYAGGLVDSNWWGSTIKNSYATGAVSGTTRVGGLVGSNGRRSMIMNCFATGAVSGDSYVGGLVGSIDEATITNCYAAGLVSGNTRVGGLLGYEREGSVIASYYDTLTTGQSDMGMGEPKYTEQMMQQSTFEGWLFVNIWDIIEGSTYPFLRDLPNPFVADDQQEGESHEGESHEGESREGESREGESTEGEDGAPPDEEEASCGCGGKTIFEPRRFMGDFLLIGLSALVLLTCFGKVR